MSNSNGNAELEAFNVMVTALQHILQHPCASEVQKLDAIDKYCTVLQWYAENRDSALFAVARDSYTANLRTVQDSLDGMWKAVTDAPEVEYEPGLDALCKEDESGRLLRVYQLLLELQRQFQ